MKVKLLQEVEFSEHLVYPAGEIVYVTWTVDGIVLGNSWGHHVVLEYGVDFVPYWNDILVGQILRGEVK